MATDREPRPLTSRQMATVHAVELALRRAHADGVAICGMDDRLLAYRADEFDRLAAEGNAAYDVQKMLGGGETINDHGAYRDSGGW